MSLQISYFWSLLVATYHQKISYLFWDGNMKVLFKWVGASLHNMCSHECRTWTPCLEKLHHCFPSLIAGKGDFSLPGTIIFQSIFRCASISSTYPCMSVGKSYFWISILSASLVALREKLKREDPNYFSILGLGKISWNWSGRGGWREKLKTKNVFS